MGRTYPLRKWSISRQCKWQFILFLRLYHTAVQNMQNHCVSKADLIKRSSIQPTERIYQNISEVLRASEKTITELTSEGSSQVESMQKILCKALHIRNLKSVKLEGKQKKGEGIMSLFGGGAKK